MPQTPPLILASTSVYRRQLLQRLGLPFEVCAPEVDETPLPGEPPPQRAARLAAAKTRAVAALLPDAVVIGSDQVASLGDGAAARILRKPGGRERCLAQLAELSGRVARFDTAVCLAWPGGGWAAHTDVTRVVFRTLSAAEIERYVDREPAFDCAGGFKCEGLGVSLMQRIESTDPTALIGLPLIWLSNAIRGSGLSIP
jgi:septum formation protein